MDDSSRTEGPVSRRGFAKLLVGSCSLAPLGIAGMAAAQESGVAVEGGSLMVEAQAGESVVPVLLPLINTAPYPFSVLRIDAPPVRVRAGRPPRQPQRVLHPGERAEFSIELPAPRGRAPQEHQIQVVTDQSGHAQTEVTVTVAPAGHAQRQARRAAAEAYRAGVMPHVSQDAQMLQWVLGGAASSRRLTVRIDPTVFPKAQLALWKRRDLNQGATPASERRGKRLAERPGAKIGSPLGLAKAEEAFGIQLAPSPDQPGVWFVDVAPHTTEKTLRSVLQLSLTPSPSAQDPASASDNAVKRVMLRARLLVADPGRPVPGDKPDAAVEK